MARWGFVRIRATGLRPARLDCDRPRLAATPDAAGHDLGAPLVRLSHDRHELLEARERAPLGFEHDVTRLDRSRKRTGVRDEHTRGMIGGAARPNGGRT